MKLYPFEMIQPESVEDVLTALDLYGDSASLIAGGTDVVVQLRTKSLKTKYIISLSKLKNYFQFITQETSGQLRIGALTTHADIENSEMINQKYPVLVDASSQVGSVQIRNVATLGGNICSALPSADIAGPLLVLDVKVKVESKEKSRLIEIQDFFVSPGKSAVKNNEMVTEITISKLPEYADAAYVKFGRRKAMEIPLLGASAYLELDQSLKSIKVAKIALSSSGPTPMRAWEAEGFLMGSNLNDSIIRKAGVIASQEAKPRTSYRSTEEYRRDVLPIFVERALRKAYKRIIDKENLIKQKTKGGS